MHVTRIRIALLALLVTACTAWRRDASILGASVPERRPVQIWSGGQSLTAHGLEVRGDSLRAVPRWKRPDCDSCARFFALAEIDSTRVRRISPVRTAVLVAVLGAWVYVTAGIAGAGGPGS
jgi:hypothetical protein